MKRRILSLLVCMAMTLSMMPASAFAAVAPMITLELPITKIVEQSGDQAPGSQTFTFELSGLGRTVEYSKISFDIETNGKNTYKENFTFTITAQKNQDLIDALAAGFYVSEKQESIDGWKIDTNSWFVLPQGYQTVSGALNSSVSLFYYYDMSKLSDQQAGEGTIQSIIAGGDTSAIDSAYSREMTFTNTYNGVKAKNSTITIPYEKIVKENGTAKAPAEDFEFEMYDFSGPDTVKKEISVDGNSIETDGAGTYKGNIVITVPENSVGDLSEGFKIKEKKGSADHWTYDESEWFVYLERDTSATAGDSWKPVILNITDGDTPYEDESRGKMTFTNLYTWSTAVKNDGKYTLHYESNGGTKYDDESYESGTTVQMNKYPYREGYTLTGWYSDKELKNQITSVKMDSDKTVYAGWNQTPVPKYLNATDHFAYIVGYEDGCIRPLNNITRAEVATIFYRLLKLDYRVKYETTENSFKDVNAKDWYCKAVSTLSKMGILKGRNATSFEPNANITRAEFAAICARCDESVENGVECFNDLDGHWAKTEIEKAAYIGWVTGYTDGSFQPNKNITRAEAFTLINRVLQRIPGSADDLLSEMTKWPDNSNSSAWYYIAVQEATCSHEYTRKTDGHEKWTKLVDNVF